MNLLYLTFGSNASIHMQAAFSICSFLSNPTAPNSVNIITDNKKYYTHLGSYVNLIELTKEELLGWRGPHDFFWRIKIKAIEKICAMYPGEAVVYLDTDTFLYGDAASLAEQLKNGHALMHENEGALSAKKSKTERKMWQQIAGKNFGKLSMAATDCMWNAGVVATPNTLGGAECKLALDICDEMCGSGVTKRLIEQYALSLALSHSYGLHHASSLIAHYWSTKEIWNNRLNDFFVEAYFAQWDTDKLIAESKALNKNDLPIYQRIKNTRLRLAGLIARAFPAKDIQYLPK
jgi:hypothetical protein